MTANRPLLVIRHVPWEGPHRILRAFGGVPVAIVDGLDDTASFPRPDEIRGAVVMGGPMSANDVEPHPGLAEEIAWLADAVAAGTPVLGVCLGSQLLARALGARVAPADEPEIGFAAVEVLDPADLLLGALAPSATVLHWHGEAFDLPPGAVALARSARTALQAFRAGDAAWGLLFHAEADAELLDRWLAEPAMAREARDALGPESAAHLRAGAIALDHARNDAVFTAFAACCAARAAA
jgi:GMP synthase (glutamine-hydrolysing)